MRFKAWHGLSETYRAAVDGHSPWAPGTVDPAAITIEDVLVDADLAPLRDIVNAEGIRALAFIPLVYQRRLLGKFMVYYDEPHRSLAEEMQRATRSLSM
jgi:GAF domain-containing protein